MFNLLMYSSTPISFNNQTYSPIPPIIYENIIYVIDYLEMTNILSAINLLESFNVFTEKKGFSKIYNWLNRKGLLNSGFLNAISLYNIKNTDFKNINKYTMLEKDSNQNIIFPDKYIKNYLKNVFLFKFISKNKESFNGHFNKYLNEINEKLNKINDENLYQFEKELEKRRFYKQVSEIFLQTLSKSIQDDYEYLKQMQIHQNTSLTLQDIKAYNTNLLKPSKKGGFNTTKTTTCECINANTVMNFSIDYDFNNVINFNIKEEFSYFSKILTESIFDFVFEDINDLKTIESNRHYYSLTNPVNKFGWGNNKIALAEKIENDLLIENDLISYLKAIKNNSNAIILPDCDIFKNLCLINLNNKNIKSLKNLFYKKNTDFKNDKIQFIVDKNNNPVSLCNFVKILN